VVAVVDASALAAVVFGEPAQADVAARLSGCELVSSELLPYELANVALNKARRSRVAPALLVQALAHARALGVRLERLDAEEAFVVARDTGLTAYDVAYLAIARRLDAPLVTLDVQLRKAADGA
jgi:predicted nucleic acid-binding protein